MAPNGSGSASGEARGCNYLEHQVTKMDTLAGIAIKYGVEVADIKRMNGLSTDLQMFALKTLCIPLPGRHPPSATPPGDCDSSRKNSPVKTPPRKGSFNMLESFESLRMNPPQKKVSPAMNTLQKYYGLKSPNPKRMLEGTEMAVYRTGSSYADDRFLPKPSPVHDTTPKYERLVNGFMMDNGVGNHVPLAEVDGEGESSTEKSVRRRQKVETSFGAGTPEKLLKEENSGGSSGFSTITGKNLALRPKSASRTSLAADGESSWLSSAHLGIGDPTSADELAGVRKSSSLSSLQEQENSVSSTILPKWHLKPELPVLSAVSIAKPIFDGLPIPISGRRNKAALD